MKTHNLPLYVFLILPDPAIARSSHTEKITGPADSFGYAGNRCSHTVISGNFNFCFSACERTGKWVGPIRNSLTLLSGQFVCRVRLKKRLLPGTIEGADNPAFWDAIPYI